MGGGNLADIAEDVACNLDFDIIVWHINQPSLNV